MSSASSLPPTPAAPFARAVEALPGTPFTITLPDGASVQACRYGEPALSGPGRPLVLHLHGGTFASGGLDNGRAVGRLLAQAGALVVSVDYPLAPLNPFPKPVEVGAVVLEWLHRTREDLAGRDARLFLAGESAGANLAAALAVVARDREQPPVAGQILLSPMLDPCTGTASLRAAACASTQACKWAAGWLHYLSKPMDALHPYAVPGASLRLARLPPTLILTGPDDPLRDEALHYARRLREAGVQVHAHIVPSARNWPEALYEPDAEAGAACEACVLQHFKDFFR